MSSFEYISVALSIVVGLALTHILRSAVAVFRRRTAIRFDALVIGWTGIILVKILGFWWSIFELDAQGIVTAWSLSSFLLLLSLAVVLYLAAALVLPSDAPDLGVYFEEDGRWAVAAVAVYSLLAAVGNTALFGSGPLEPSQLGLYFSAVVLVVVVLVKRRWLRLGLSAIYFVMSFLGMLAAMPLAYPA